MASENRAIYSRKCIILRILYSRNGHTDDDEAVIFLLLRRITSIIFGGFIVEAR